MALNPNPSLLDQQQIIQRVMDGDNDRLRVDAIVSATIADVIIHSDESSITIGTPDNGNTLNIENDGSINANVVLNSGTDSVTVIQGTTPWVVSGNVNASQSGVWTTGRTWTTGFSTDSMTVIQGDGFRIPSAWDVEGTVDAVQSGTWNIGTLTSIINPVSVTQGTSPWVVSGSITTSPDVNIHDSAGNTLSSTGTSLDVNVTNTVPVSQSGSWTVIANQGTSPWVISGTVTANAGTGNFTVVQSSGANLHVNIDNFPATTAVTQSTTPWIVDGSGFTQPVSGTITALQGTSPWVVSGTITTSPDVNIHDSAGNALTSTNGSLNVDVTNIVPVSQSGSWTVTANQGTSPWIVSGTVAATQSGTWSVGRTWTLSNSTDSVASVQSGTWNIGTVTTITNPVTVNQGTSPWVVSGTVTTSPNVNVHDGTGVSISSTGSSLNVDVTNIIPVSQSGSWTVAATQSGTWTTGRTWTLSSGTDSVTVTGSVSTGSEGTIGAVAPTKATQVGGFDGSGNLQAVNVVTLGTTPVSADYGFTTNSLMYGLTTGGGGGYVPVKVNPSGSITVDPGTVTVTGTVAATQSGTWNIGTVTTITNPVAVTQSTSPWVVSGTVTANQGTSPWVVSGTVTANAGTGNFTVVQSSGANLHVNVDNFPATVAVTQSTSPWVVSGTVAATQSGTWTTGRTWALSSGTDSIAAVQSGTWNIGTVTTITNPVAVTQSTSPWVVSGTVTANQGTSPWVISGTVATSNFPSTVDTNYGVVGANTIRTAAQIGNATGAALFGAGITTAQVLRVVLPTDQTAIPVTQSTSPWVVTENSLGTVAAGIAGTQSNLAGMIYNTATPAPTNGQQLAIQSDENGGVVVTESIRAFTADSKVYSSQTPSILIGTAETNFILFRNPNASGKTVKIFKMTFVGTGTMRVYSLPTVTGNGTTVAPQLRKITSGAQGNVGLTTTSPTTSAVGTLIDVLPSPAQAIAIYDFPSYIILPANTSILITAQMGANNTATFGKIEWAEL